MPLTILGTKDNPQYFETVVSLFEQLSATLKHRDIFQSFCEDSYKESLYDSIVRVTPFKNFNDFLELNNKLSLEIKIRFLDYKETKLQDRYGNFIVNSLINYMIPVYNEIKKGYDEIQIVYPKEEQLNPEQRKNLEHRFLLLGICLRLFEWIDTICMHLQAFTLELYERYSRLIKSVKPIIADLPSIRPSLDPIEQEINADRSTITIQAIEPTIQQRPEGDYTRCLDQVRSLSHNATFLLGFNGFITPTKYAEYLQKTTPQLLNESFCNGLNNGLNTEIRNNFMRFTESKVQDRYATDLIRVLNETLNPALETFDQVIERLSSQKNIETEKYIPKSKEFFTSAEFVHYQKEINGLVGPNIRVRIWRDTIEQFLYDYTPEYYRKYKGDRESLLTTELKFVESQTKLQWNGTNRTLYDLFAQLTLIDSKPGKRLVGNTIKELARFLSECVAGLPSAETVERELEKMREPQGVEKAKRGRIDLHITRDAD